MVQPARAGAQIIDVRGLLGDPTAVLRTYPAVRFLRLHIRYLRACRPTRHIGTTGHRRGFLELASREDSDPTVRA